MSIRQRFERWMKFRFAVIYPFGIFVLLAANPSDRSIQASIGFVIAGILIRLWANGYAIKMDKLTTSGPYAFVRNPLYLGTVLIALGMVVMLQSYIAGSLFLAAFLTGYYFTIKKEEAMLEAKFKQDYLDYKKHTWAMIPRFFPYRKGEKWPFSFQRLMKSKEYKTAFWLIIVIIIFHFKNEFFVERGKWEPHNLWLIGLAVLLMTIDFTLEFVKSRKRKKEKQSS